MTNEHQHHACNHSSQHHYTQEATETLRLSLAGLKELQLTNNNNNNSRTTGIPHPAKPVFRELDLATKMGQ
ncbi:hypothetical protein AND_005249 [Anopheles darlingi]|uniref:Uncharacterized protein n=1 Tax=Anopheles darlingi TaxID=43151 RepID=W5JID8_ANODA|nr:hypothetical protein AND_005249 [Anopheles darlingi]